MNPNPMDPRQGLQKLATGKKPLRVRMLIDYSVSIRQRNLEAAMMAAVDQITADLAAYPSNRVCRAIFADELHELDGLNWVSPAGLTVNNYHAVGPSTHLDEFLVKEMNRLMPRAKPESGFIDVVLVATDGENTGPDATTLINQFTHRLMTKAALEGGLEKSSAAVWYWGIGMTEGFHLGQAKRFGLPRQWTTWSDATPEEVQHTSSGLGRSLRSISELGEGTIIGGM